MMNLNSKNLHILGRCGYVSLDNDGIAEELWFLRHELPGPENKRDLLEEFVPWEQRKEIYLQDRDLPEL